MNRLYRGALFATVGLGAIAAAHAEPITLNVTGLVSTHVHHTALEKEFYETLAEKTGLDITVNFNPLDVIGVSMDDTLRMASDGTFDIVQSTIGNISRDDPFLEGVDLIGVSSMEDARDTAEVFRETFSARSEARMNVKTLSLHPYGPQMVFCNGPIEGLADLQGKRVRSYSRTMSALLEHVGATPVSMPFAEVYPALQRGVVECAITSITSANSGSWPEIATHVLPLALSNGMNAHFMNLDKWNSLEPEAQQKLADAFRGLEEDLWALTAEMYDDALRCSTGGEPCEHYTAYDMTVVEPDDADRALLAEAVDEVVLDVWAQACQPTEECVSAWNETIGAARGFEISAN